MANHWGWLKQLDPAQDVLDPDFDFEFEDLPYYLLIPMDLVDLHQPTS